MIALDVSTSYLSMYPSIAGYSSDLDLTDVQPVSPSFAKPDLDPIDDGLDLDELEDRALSEGKTSGECEAQALLDELQAIALEVALKATVKHSKGLIDPATGLVPAGRRQDGTSPAVAYIRSCFRLATLQATVKRLRDRALRLRREADRKYQAEATSQQKSHADHTDVQPKRTAKRTKSVLLRDGKVVPKESRADARKRRYFARMAAAAHT